MDAGLWTVTIAIPRPRQLYGWSLCRLSRLRLGIRQVRFQRTKRLREQIRATSDFIFLSFQFRFFYTYHLLLWTELWQFLFAQPFIFRQILNHETFHDFLSVLINYLSCFQIRTTTYNVDCVCHPDCSRNCHSLLDQLHCVHPLAFPGCVFRFRSVRVWIRFG